MSYYAQTETNYRGCFLIGSGPSLNRVDVRLLADRWTIAFNRSYIAWDEWRFEPTFYAALNPRTIDRHAQDIRNLIQINSVKHFFLNSSGAAFDIQASARVTLVDYLPGQPFSASREAVCDYGNVGASFLQLLDALGFEKVVLLGVEALYTQTTIPQAKDFLMVDQDNDHFHTGYSRLKRRLTEQELKGMVDGCTSVADACRRAGRMDIRIASPGTALRCFPVMEFEDALEWVNPHSVAESIDFG